MKLHDLRPPRGATAPRIRVGRGIAAGKGKTAGRGTKGQNSRAGGGVPAWHEGGQTPLHIRVPKLRGFKRRFKVTYEVVNVGLIADAADKGRFADAEGAAAEVASRGGTRRPTDAPLTVNAEILRQARLISKVRRPVKVLGEGEVRRKLFVVADAFTKSAREKIEAAGGTAQVLEIPGQPTRTGEQQGGAKARPARPARPARATETAEEEAPEDTAARDGSTPREGSAQRDASPARDGSPQRAGSAEREETADSE
jgi:large subunit ribosomal protein L15